MAKRLSRRSFIVGCSTAIAALAGSRITNLAFAEPSASGAYNEDILVVVFLRGGWDALNVLPPLGGGDRGVYESARPNLRVPTAGQNALINLNGQFGLHPAMAPLQSLYQAQKLAFIHACGLTADTRSHFDAMQYMELGTPNVKTTPTGWLTRHLQTAGNLPPTILFPALSAGGSTAMSLMGTPDAVAMSNPNGFQLNGHWNFESAQRAALRDLYTTADPADWLRVAGSETLDTIDLIEQAAPGTYAPANGAQYPGGSFGENLQAIAQLVKMNVGLRVATVDLGGWDTHEYQGDGATGYFNDRLSELARGLKALYTDLDTGCPNFNTRTTTVVMSEFGRRLKENANHGTDHGHGSAMLVLGGNVRGGQVYGQWPGLGSSQLYDGYDLAITTDYRRVFAEIITRRLGNGGNLSAIFPNYTYTGPLNFINGNDPVAAPPPAGPYRLYLPNLRNGGGTVCP